LKQEKAYSLWIWLVYNKTNGMLQIELEDNNQIIFRKNQDLEPLLNIDLWEHAYGEDYKS